MLLPLYVAILRFILHAGFAFVPFVSLCVIACFILRVIVYALPSVCWKVAFHCTRVCRLHVCFAFVPLVCLCLSAYVASDCVCVCFCMLQCCV